MFRYLRNIKPFYRRFAWRMAAGEEQSVLSADFLAFSSFLRIVTVVGKANRLEYAGK
jgi:hypothetical protein